ncbi:hypothetical protein GGR39_002342 [Novosphingobium fluoreni]|uniref:Uncharacterized protein n=1 Tax=Novosphingobium fluoreni TaxID=1391222 RepID=A0A7W6C210_9SPHN|nr:hypothetical protein [Novosphingobium fluoreni]MBB3940685.1 hypothetical protein [Novosphingobium fluoreni]
MTVYRRSADWSVGYYSALRMDTRVPDYTGWTFAATLAKHIGDPDGIALGMAANSSAQGFFVKDGPAQLLTLRILPETLQAYPDASGQFELFANVLATPPGGARLKVFDLILTVVRGPTP